jgi:hypothetical protein
LALQRLEQFELVVAVERQEFSLCQELALRLLVPLGLEEPVYQDVD